MEEAAVKRNFEKAIFLRERYNALNKILEDQKVSTEGDEDQDIFGIANSTDTSNVTLLIKRGGKIVGKRDFLVTNPSGEEDVLGRFLALYYPGRSEPPEHGQPFSPDHMQLTAREFLEEIPPKETAAPPPDRAPLTLPETASEFQMGVKAKGGISDEERGRILQEAYPDDSPDIPKEIIIPFRVEGMSTLKSFFQQRYGKSVSLCIPQKGMKKRLVDLANKNALQKIKEQLFKYNPQSSLVELKSVLGLPRTPHLIEGFDVATLLGSFSVASMVRFKDALPDKNAYRRFKIRFVSEQNDVEMLKEAVARRYQRLLNEKKQLPDMILVDGGKPQVNAVHGILNELGLSDLPLIGLAKQQEEIFPFGMREPILMEKRSNALRLLMAIRDEAHRFANTYHVKIRGRETTLSKLREIPGIGNALLQKILSSGVPLNGEVTSEALRKIEGIGEKRAEQIARVLSEAATGLEEK
jgi:excinuclease UvrABC nuclease subunit